MPGRILIVEPQAEIALLIRTELVARGYEVELASDGPSGREAVRRGSYDLLIVETVLPRMSGIDLAREFRQIPSVAETPLVLLDSLNANENVTIESARQACSAAAFYRTPLSMAPFVDVLAHLAGDTGRPRCAVILPTPIDGESVPKLIRAFYDFRKTGKLTVRSRGPEKSVYFHEGMPLFVSSSQMSDHLGSMLRAEGVIDREGIDRLLRKQRESGLRFGQLAIQEGYLDETALYAHLARQLVRVTSSLFTLEDGEMYVEDIEPLAEELLPTPLHPFHLIRAAIELGFSEDKLRKRLSPGDRYLVPVATATFLVQSIRMSELELEFLRRIDGTRTIDDLRAVPPLTEPLNMQLIATLIYTRMIWLSDRPAGPNDLFARQAERYQAEHEFHDDFFFEPWDQSDPGVIHRGDRTYKVIRDTSAQPAEEPAPTLEPDERPTNPDRMLFFAISVLAAVVFVLFLLSIRPYFEARQLDAGRVERAFDEQVVRPTFLKAVRHYEKGVELMASGRQADLVAAQREFLKALAVDARYDEAITALRETQARLGNVGGTEHFIEPPAERDDAGAGSGNR